MQRFASVCDLELQTIEMEHQRLHMQPKRGVASLSRRQVQRMALLALLAATCAISCLIFTISTAGSDVPQTRVLESMKSLLGLERYPNRSDGTQQSKKQREFALSISQLAQQTTTPRGVVMPLFDDIAYLGLSAILELRGLGVDLPIEIPHCGDFNSEFQRMIESRDPLVRVYDVCAQALSASNEFGSGEKLFCDTMEQCHDHFRGFSIKVISVLFSRFDEVMLVDADTLFFQNPMKLWDLARYKQTGTLFFHDRISTPDQFLALPVADSGDGRPVTHLHWYLSTFDVSPYRALAHIPRRRATAKNAMPAKPHFAPSDFLLSSHSWNMRAGHEMDSSLVLWNKRKQPRATTIVASFLAQNGAEFPPSYGDKELFFIACELAETQYAFSDFGVGSLGTELQGYGDKADSVLCGSGLHYFPVTPSPTSSSDRIQPLYVNSDELLTLDVNGDEIYRTVARAADLYPGSFAERDLPQECPFDITALPLSAAEKAKIAQRQHLHRTVQSWALAP